MYLKLVLTGIIFFGFFGCTSISMKSLPDGNKYAMGFSIEEHDGFRKLIVRNPWEKARNVEIEYFLIDKQSEVPESLKDKNIIRTPVRRMVCLSSSHIAFVDVLDESDKIKGVSGADYISNPKIREGLRQGSVTDVGYGVNLNYEEIIRQNADVVMAYGVDSEITGFISKFNDLRIPAILNAEFLEPDPLGKTEWIRFVGHLFNKGEMADSVFSRIESRYNALKNSVTHGGKKPLVMVGLPYRDSWWVPGGDSYLARLIEDAGGEYIGKNNPSRESYVISLEEALLWGAKADVWINTGMVGHIREILALDNRFSRFNVIRNGRIYNNNKRVTGMGGNDFWESGTVYPDRILEDLIRIFHPSEGDEDDMHYYLQVR